METQELLSFIYFVIFTVGAVFIALLCVDFKVCYECTRAWNGLRFMLDMRYWAMSILYKRYQDAQAKAISTDKFIIDFTDRYLLDMSNSKWRFLPEKAKITFIEILSSPKFIDQYLAVDKYSYTYHKEVMTAWDQFKQQKAKNRSQSKDIHNF